MRNPSMKGQVTKGALLFAFLFFLAAYVAVLFFQELQKPPDKWQHLMTRESLKTLFRSDKIARNDILAYLGTADQNRLMKGGEDWFEFKLVRKKLTVVYDQGPDGMAQNPAVVDIIYSASITVADHKFDIKAVANRLR